MKKLLIITLATLFSSAAFSDPVVQGTIEEGPLGCRAHSPAFGANNNTWMSGTADSIKVTVTKSGRVNASCHVEDISGVYENQAEQIKIDECLISLPGGGFVIGTGHATAAANQVDEDGGNLKVVCHGKLSEEPI